MNIEVTIWWRNNNLSLSKDISLWNPIILAILLTITGDRQEEC
jgi:hypothetical protein